MDLKTAQKNHRKATIALQNARGKTCLAMARTAYCEAYALMVALRDKPMGGF